MSCCNCHLQFRFICRVHTHTLTLSESISLDTSPIKIHSTRNEIPQVVLQLEAVPAFTCCFCLWAKETKSNKTKCMLEPWHQDVLVYAAHKNFFFSLLYRNCCFSLFLENEAYVLAYYCVVNMTYYCSRTWRMYVRLLHKNFLKLILSKFSYKVCSNVWCLLDIRK